MGDISPLMGQIMQMEPKQEAVIEGPPGIESYPPAATQMAASAVVPQQGWSVPIAAPVSLLFFLVFSVSHFFFLLN